MTKFTQQDIIRLVEHLKKGDSVLFPSDTVWGLGCDAQNTTAIAQIAQLKQQSMPYHFVLLVSNLKMLQQYITNLPPKAGDLIEYYERPLTIIYDKAKNLPESILAADGSIAIRVANDPFCRAFIDAFGAAVLSTVAQVAGAAFPKSFHEIPASIKNSVGYTVDYKQNIVSEFPPSTVVRLDENNELVFVRR